VKASILKVFPVLSSIIWLIACTHLPHAQEGVTEASHQLLLSDSIAQHKQLAKRYEADGDLSSAAIQWHVLTLIAPDEESFRTELARLEKIIPRSADQAYQSGLAALRKGNDEDASRLMLQTLALIPDHAGAAQALSDIERQRISRVQANKAARVKRSEGLLAGRQPQTSARQPYELDQQIEIFTAGDVAGGLREMHRYVASNPKDKAGRQRIAKVVYDEALKLDGKGSSESAVGLYEQAIVLRGDRPVMWDARVKALQKTLADTYYEKGMRAYRSDIAVAINDWETCLRYNPQHTNAALRLKDARLSQETLRRIEKQSGNSVR